MSQGRSQFDVETLEALFQARDCPCERLTSDTVRTVLHGTSRTLTVLARIEPTGYLVLAVAPYLRTPQDSARARRLYRRLLQLNAELWMAKFSVDEDGDVVLSTEYPLVRLDRSEFDDALDVLCYYADRYDQELRRLAQGSEAESQSP